MGARARDGASVSGFAQYIRALLRDGNEEGIFAGLSELQVPQPFLARMKVLYCPEGEASGVENLAAGSQVQGLSEHGPAFVYQADVGRSRERIEVPFVVLSANRFGLPRSVLTVASVCRSFEWATLRRYLRSRYPHLVPILLSQRELVSGVRSLRATTGHAVQVRSYTARERIESPRSRESKVKRVWTDEDLDKVISSVEERSEVITSLDVTFLPVKSGATHIVPSAICTVRKTGEVEVDGSFRIAFDTVARVVAEAGHKKLAFFSNRGLKSTQYVPRPLAITYAQPVFDDVEAVRTFVRVISKYPHSMRAVQHGNPYAHVRVMDVLDYSSFDIWAVPPQRVIILPCLRASEGAFERFVDFVFERFREGDVVEYHYVGSDHPSKE